MDAKRLEEIRERAELSRKRDWVVPREAIEDIDGLLEHIGELTGALQNIVNAYADNDGICTDIFIAIEEAEKLIGGSGE